MNLTHPTPSPCAAQVERIVFFEKNALMGIELLDLLDNFTLVVHDDDAACAHLKPNFALVPYDKAGLVAATQADWAVQCMLDDTPFLEKLGLLDTRPGAVGALLFRFESNEPLDALVQARKMALLVASSAIQERLGSKLYLPTLGATLGKALVPLVPSRTFSGMRHDNAALFAQCAAELGLPFIVQGAQGAGGRDTFLIESADQMAQALVASKGQIRAARYIAQHISLSTHVCVGDGAPLIRGPYLQLVGLPELAAQAFRFCGNDTNQSLFDAALIERARSISSTIAQHVQAQGYCGIFGIDFIRDNASGVLYVQELNMRMVGLTRLLTGMQKDQGMQPDMLAYLRAHGCALALRAGAPLGAVHAAQAGADAPEHDHAHDYAHDYAQIMIRHHAPMAATTQQVQHFLAPGIYQWLAGHLHKRSDSLFVHDMVPGELLVLMAANPGICPDPGDLLARIIVKESILVQGEYRLNPRFCELVAALRRHILGEPRT